NSTDDRSSRLRGGDMPPLNRKPLRRGIAHAQTESICRARPSAPLTEFASKPLLQRGFFRRMRRRSAPISRNSLLFSLLYQVSERVTRWGLIGIGGHLAMPPLPHH